MTEILFVKSNGKYRGFECHGHAGYADEGEDIICAALSVLTINTINSLDLITKDEIDVETDDISGDMKVYFKKDSSKGGELLMESLLLGLTSIASQYGEQFVKVEIQEV